MNVEFVSLQWLELVAWNPGLIVYSRPINSQYLHPLGRWDD